VQRPADDRGSPAGVRRQGFVQRIKEIRNSQGVVSLECHSVAAIGFGLRIFRDGGSRL
jgi:hypothetical protein